MTALVAKNIPALTEVPLVISGGLPSGVKPEALISFLMQDEETE